MGNAITIASEDVKKTINQSCGHKAYSENCNVCLKTELMYMKKINSENIQRNDATKETLRYYSRLIDHLVRYKKVSIIDLINISVGKLNYHIDFVIHEMHSISNTKSM